jgi:protein ImuA
MSRPLAMTLPNAFLPASGLACLSTHTPRWRPGLAGAHHSEVFAPSGEASGTGAALALIADALSGKERENSVEADDLRALLWVQDRQALRLGGRPYRPGLPKAFRHSIVHVLCDNCEDVLFALEEGLRCRDVAAVIGELAGNPRALDFTASRRLTLTAEKHGVPLWLVRLDAGRDLSSARMRWDVRSAPSPHPRWNDRAPGIPSWKADLFRSRMHPPGTWTLYNDGHELVAAPFSNDDWAGGASPHPLGLAFAAGDRSLAAG